MYYKYFKCTINISNVLFENCLTSRAIASFGEAYKAKEFTKVFYDKKTDSTYVIRRNGHRNLSRILL